MILNREWTLISASLVPQPGGRKHSAISDPYDVGPDQQTRHSGDENTLLSVTHMMLGQIK